MQVFLCLQNTESDNVYLSLNQDKLHRIFQDQVKWFISTAVIKLGTLWCPNSLSPVTILNSNVSLNVNSKIENSSWSLFYDEHQKFWLQWWFYFLCFTLNYKWYYKKTIVNRSFNNSRQNETIYYLPVCYLTSLYQSLKFIIYRGFVHYWKRASD